MQTILITGAASGIGFTIADTLHKKGYKVFGTSRSPEKYSDHFPFELLSLDITSSDSVQNCVSILSEKTKTIDVLINNAGIVVVGSAEETKNELARKQFETNFWGAVNMTKAVLPFMRKQRSGKIITIGSLAGLIGVPFESYYAASKHAIEGFFKSLRFEVKAFNIQVSVIEPGFFKTNLMSDPDLYAKPIIDDYNEIRSGPIDVINESFDNAPPPKPVADTVLKILASKDPKFSYRVGKDTTTLPFLQFISNSMFEKGAAKHFKI